MSSLTNRGICRVSGNTYRQYLLPARVHILFPPCCCRARLELWCPLPCPCFVVVMRNGHFWNWYNNSNIIIHSVHPTVSGQNQNVTKCKYCSFIIVGMPCSLLVIPPSVSCPQVEVVGSMLVPARHTQECVLQYRSGWWHASLCLLCQAYPRVCPTPRPSPSFTH